MSKKRPVVKYKFDGIKIDNFTFVEKSESEIAESDKLVYELSVTSFLNKTKDEGIIKVKYTLLSENTTLTSITAKNYFTIKDIPPMNEAVNKKFMELMKFLAINSIAHTRGLHFYLLEEKNSPLKKFTLPFLSPNKLKNPVFSPVTHEAGQGQHHE